MIFHHNAIRLQLHDALIHTLKCLGKKVASEKLFFHWTLPPRKDMGHMSFPCFPLAKALGCPPQEIAEKLREKLSGNLPSKSWNFIKEVAAAGPYLNFTLNMETVAPFLIDAIEKRIFFSRPFGENLPKTMIEYFQPNTHKSIHVGHLRNLCLGQAMVEIHRYLGYQVVSASYPGDSGTHVAKVLWYLERKKPPTPLKNRGKWLGSAYAEATQQWDREKENEPHALANIIKDIARGSGKTFHLWKETREWSLQHIREICSWAEVDFDQWYFESEVDIPSLALAQKLFKEKKLIKDDGAIIMDLRDEKLGVCLLVKRDGNGLYATKDLELARRKFEDHGIKKNIYVVDKRQSLHFKQVFQTLEKIGYENAKYCYHLAYEFVELPEGAISSRTGNIVSAQTLIEEMEKNHWREFSQPLR